MMLPLVSLEIRVYHLYLLIWLSVMLAYLNDFHLSALVRSANVHHSGNFRLGRLGQHQPLINLQNSICRGQQIGTMFVWWLLISCHLRFKTICPLYTHNTFKSYFWQRTLQQSILLSDTYKIKRVIILLCSSVSCSCLRWFAHYSPIVVCVLWHNFSGWM